MSCSAVAGLLILGVTSCAPELNRKQTLTWDACKECQAEGPLARLEQVREDGGWKIVGREGEVYKVGNCMLEYLRTSG